MAAPSVGGVAVPASMAGRGKYTFKRQAVIVAGDGTGYASGPQSAEWVFPYLNQTELNWWITQMSTDTVHPLTAAELWDDAMIEQAFTSGNLYRPECQGGYHSGLYHDVLIRFDWLMPLL